MRAFLLSALALTACSSSDTPDPGDPGDPGPVDPGDPAPPDEAQRDYDDVAKSIGASIQTGELQAMVDVVILSVDGTPPGLSRINAGEVVGERNGVTFHYTYHCNDTADVIIDACDDRAHHEHVHVLWSGDLAGAPMSGIVREGDWTVRDLLVDKPRVGGDGHMSYVHQMESDGSTYDLTYDATFDHVRFVPGGGLPSMGTIDYAITIHRTRSTAETPERDFAIAANVTFAADGSGTITLDSTHTYALDLTTGLVTGL